MCTMLKIGLETKWYRIIVRTNWGNPAGKNLPGDSTDNPGTYSVSVEGCGIRLHLVRTSYNILNIIQNICCLD